MTREVKVGLFIVLVLAGAAPLSSARPGVPFPGRIVVELTEEGARALQDGRLQVPIPPGGEVLDPQIRPLFLSRSGPLSRFAILTFRADRPDSPPSLRENTPWIEAVRGLREVIHVESDQAFRMSALPDDPYLLGDGGLPEQFHLVNPGGLSLEATRAWPFLPAGHGVVVAVLDSGVDWEHPDLGGPTPPGGVIHINEAEASGTPGVDDDQNGYIDDVIGWDFVHLTSAPGGGANPASGEDSVVPDNNPADFAGHGTQVAGFVTAITDNGTGIAGAVPDARILPVRVGWKGIDGGAWVLMSFCAQGVEYAALNGAQVINCSWDSADLQGLGAALDLAIDTHDVVVVGSAGNEGKSTSSIQYVAMRPDVLGVAGVLEDGTRSSVSNYGSWVSIAAFFRGPPSTYFNSGTGASTYLVNPAGGTSFAAPQVSALAALLRAVDPSADAATIRTVIETNGQDLGPQGLGGGLADFARSAQALGSGWDNSFRARGLTAFGPSGESFAATGDSTLALYGAETGPISSVPASTVGQQNLLPVVAGWGAAGDILIREEGNLLKAVHSNLDPVSGWPVALPTGAGQPVSAAFVPGESARIYVPHRDDVLILSEGTAAVDSTSLGLPLVAMAIGEPDEDTLRVMAGVDTTGKLRVWSESPSFSGTPFIVGLDSVSTALVIGEFLGPGQGEVVVVDDQVDPGPTRNIYFVGPDGTVNDSVAVSMGRPASLSLAGFGSGLRVEVVATDTEGRVRLISRGGSVTALDLAAPLAGEILCADLNGDYESDLVGLCRDGTLLAWDSALELLEGFPRRLPNGAIESPLIQDGEGRQDGPERRFVVVADTAGTLWSIPFGPVGRPAPWPTARGSASRNGFLGFARATPVLSPEMSLSWNWQENGKGSICWLGTGLADYSRFRLRKGEVELWSGGNGASGCLNSLDVEGSEVLRLEGQRRDGAWDPLGEITVPLPGLFAAHPHPNPFRSGTRLTWSGAASGGVTIAIFDVRGRRIFEQSSSARNGEFLWRGLDQTGRPVSPGAYFIRMDDGVGTAVRRILRLGNE